MNTASGSLSSHGIDGSPAPRRNSAAKHRRACSRRGSALLSSLFVATVLIGTAGTYLFVSFGGYESGNRELAGVRARFASDEGLQRSMAELKSGVDAGGDGLGTITFDGADERRIQVTATDLGGNLFRLHSRGAVTRAALACDTLIEVIPPQALGFPARAAITSHGQVTTSGNITVDGRDWNWAGTAVTGPGVFGVSCVNSISQNGSSTIGGNGLIPFQPALPGTTEPLASWADGSDNDGDGGTDEEAFDGIDNDADGLVDEDTNDYPTTPDVLFHLAPDTLKNAAIAAGTYFNSQAGIDAYIAANGGDLPGGKVFYCDFSLWLPVNFGNNLNDQPSIIVQHNASGTALMKNLHGAFKGLILSDNIMHINGDFLLVGGLMSFAPESVGNAYGNGGASIRFSSVVLNNLPAANANTRVRVKAWSRSSAN